MSFTNRIKNWVKDNRLEAFFLALTILTAAFLRLYRIDEYLTFLGDEGRDVIIVRRLLVNFDPILIGPGTSIGNMYLGPLYYYFIAPGLLLANFSPVGPAVMVALLGILTVYLVWYATREWFGKFGAFVAAFLFAISPTVIIYSKSSWNPNIMPFFSLLSIYSIWRVFKYNQFKWLIVLGISLAMVMNSHYLGLLLFPVIFVFWLISFIKLKSDRSKSSKTGLSVFTKLSLLSGAVFVFLMSPVVIFDARHGWRNFIAMKTFFSERQTTVSAKPWTSLPKLLPLSQKIAGRLVSGANLELGKYIVFSLVISLAVFLWNLFKVFSFKKFIKAEMENHIYGFILTGLWLAIALVGLGLYKQEIYDHYYGFFFAAPFILIGGLYERSLQLISLRNFAVKLIIYLFLIIGFAGIVLSDLAASPLKYPPNRQLQRSEEVSRKIITESSGREFNIAVIAERNYEGAYQYYLEKVGAPVVAIDPQIPSSVTDQLFVICELPKEKCDPTHDPKAGIANFGWSTIDRTWEVAGVELFRLVHVKK